VNRDPAFEDWVGEARRADVLRVAMALPGGSHLGPGHCTNVPCPGCGGIKRFSVNTRKNIFYCRETAVGGDAIALVRHATGGDFLDAVELITGRPMPGKKALTEQEKKERAERLAALDASRQAHQARAEAEHNEFRDREIRRARKIWDAAQPMAGSAAEAYLEKRGVGWAPNARLRSLAALPYWHRIGADWRIIHEGPALVAAIAGPPEGGFIGCHCTWIDLAQAKGKAAIAHPETGELLAAKKVRGSHRGGHIRLGGEGRCARLFVGEGIETVYAVREALVAAGQSLADTWFWSSVNMGNLGGKAANRSRHPVLTHTDARGRVRPVFVPGPLPLIEDTRSLAPPEEAVDIVLLGDGDSDRLTTENVLKRFAARHARPGRTIRAAWADDGKDFGDMWQGERAA